MSNGSPRPVELSVSVVVIGTDGSRGIGRAVESVFAQDQRPLELVLFGNGGSLPAPTQAPDDVAVVLGSSPRNLGVAGGRNAAAALARGEVLVFLDDDAVLHGGALRAATAVLEQDPAVAAVAFSVVDPASGLPALWYHPYDPHVWRHRSFEANCVIGCGHALRRSDFEALGGFWDGYFRELEEIDLSWRLLDRRRVIAYEPGAVVSHPERHARHLRNSVRSNLLLLWRLLPTGLALRQALLKSALLLARALRHGELREYLRGLQEAARGLRGAGRAPLGSETVRYLRRVHAPQGAGKRLQWSLRRLPAPPPQGGQPGSASGAGRARSAAAAPITPPHSATR
jgi:GT2 family glycosyltransferase